MAGCLRSACVGLLVLLLPCCALAGRDNQGKEFILGFMENEVFHHTDASDIELFVTTASDNPVTVTVTTPLYNSSFKVQETIVMGSTTMFTIPHGIRGEGNEKSNKGVLVQATDEVTVYSVNKEVKSTDAYVSLPTDVLGTEYYAVTYRAHPEVLVVGTEDNTCVNISCPVSDQHCDITDAEAYGKDEMCTVRLDKFETYHLILSSSVGDYTGAHITSTKPVTVISGNKKVKVTDEVYQEKKSADHLTEQMMPVATWGTKFNTPSTPNRGIGDHFRIVASQDKTSVLLHNGTTILIDKAGHFIEFDQPSGQYQTISSSAPVMVAMFSKTWQGSTVDGDLYGDPSMSIIIPEPQYASDYTWSTVREATGKEFHSTVLVIVDKAKVPGLRLDGDSVQWKEEKEILGNPEKVHLWVKVTDGSHTLYHVDPTVTFMAMVSGVFLHNSYAYLAGLRLAEINAVCVPTFNTTMQIADVVDNDCDGQIDEELLDEIDNDEDGRIDEDVSQYPITNYACQVKGDPHLTQFSGQRGSIPFPCQYHVAFLRFNDYDQAGIPTFNQSVVEVNITATNKLTHAEGQYYVEYVSVAVVIIASDGVKTPVGIFTTWSDKIYSSLTKTAVTLPPGHTWKKEWATDNAQLRSRIQMTEIPKEELAELTVSGTSLRVQFRPFNQSKKLHPGVTVEVAGDVIPDDRALYPATMCSTIHDRRSPVFKAWGASVTFKDVGLYAALKQALTQTIGDGPVMCSELIDVYRDCAIDQTFALGNCSKALSDPAVLKCAKDIEIVDPILWADAGYHLFKACLDVFCVPGLKLKHCLSLKNYNKDCPGKWPEIDEICPISGA